MLLEAPATAPGLVALFVLLILASRGESSDGRFVWFHDASYPERIWLPCAFVLLALLLVSLLVVPGRRRDIPRPTLVAGGCLAAFTAWSYLSIAWADAAGEAWTGANRTLLYLIAFVLFAAWPQRGRTAAAVLGTWTLAIVILAGLVLLQATNSANPLRSFIAYRLADPTGYPNASAATFLMALWPALTLAGRPELPWPLRGIFAGGAVMLADVALLTQSRGAFYCLPIAVLLFFAIVPGRSRTLAVTFPVAIAIGLTAPGLFHGIDRLRGGAPPLEEMANLARPIMLASLAVAGVVALGAALEGTRRVLPETADRMRRGIGIAGAASGVGIVVVTIAVTGDPFRHLSNGWETFKRGRPVIQVSSGSRLTAGLGSNRYDFYRVSLNTFAGQPLGGVGADNFAQDYLAHGRSDETPRYPHSLEMRVLEQTGLVGALLLIGAFAAALLAALSAIRRRGPPLGAAVAGASTMVFVYWLLHGSFDWFWEFAGLGAPAFAMLGLACALAPRRSGNPGAADESPRRADPPLISGRLPIAGAAIGALGAAAVLALPWLAERHIKVATKTWPSHSDRAFHQLDQAASLNPLSDHAYLIAGTIATRLGDLGRAQRAFERARERNPGGVYATLELGAIASTRGQRERAERLLARAHALSPRDSLIEAALDRVRRGERVDLAVLNQQILTRANRLRR